LNQEEIFKIVLGGGTLQILQKLLQYIKYFILEFILRGFLNIHRKTIIKSHVMKGKEERV
jgi:hypothetical protein